jgi:hypothetical protein
LGVKNKEPHTHTHPHKIKRRKKKKKNEENEGGKKGGRGIVSTSNEPSTLKPKASNKMSWDYQAQPP